MKNRDFHIILTLNGPSVIHFMLFEFSLYHYPYFKVDFYSKTYDLKGDFLYPFN